MNTDMIKGDWNITKGKLKQKYANLTDNDLIYVKGKEDELLGRIQKRTGRARDEIKKFFNEECGCDVSFDSRSNVHPATQPAGEPDCPRNEVEEEQTRRGGNPGAER